MSGAPLSIKLRCASWQQLATIYKRDLSRGSMFLKASTQPAIGTLVTYTYRGITSNGTPRFATFLRVRSDA